MPSTIGIVSSTFKLKENDYLVHTQSTTTFINIYQRVGDTFTRQTNPAVVPAGAPTERAISAQKNLLAIAHATTPFGRLYSRSGATFTQITFTNPNANSRGVSLSADSVFMIIGTSSGILGCQMWRIIDGVATAVRNPFVGNDGFPSEALFLAFSPLNNYLAGLNATTPSLTIFKKTGSNSPLGQLDWTKITTGISTVTSTPTDLGWSPDETYLAVTANSSPFINIYKRSGDAFTRLSNPASLPPNVCKGVSWSPDGIYMALAVAVSPFINIYKRSGDTFTKLGNPTGGNPPGACNGVSFNSTGEFLALSSTVSPFLVIYKRSGDTFTKQTNPATMPTAAGSGVAFISPSSPGSK